MVEEKLYSTYSFNIYANIRLNNCTTCQGKNKQRKFCCTFIFGKCFLAADYFHCLYTFHSLTTQIVPYHRRTRKRRILRWAIRFYLHKDSIYGIAPAILGIHAIDKCSTTVDNVDNVDFSCVFKCAALYKIKSGKYIWMAKVNYFAIDFGDVNYQVYIIIILWSLYWYNILRNDLTGNKYKHIPLLFAVIIFVHYFNIMRPLLYIHCTFYVGFNIRHIGFYADCVMLFQDIFVASWSLSYGLLNALTNTMKRQSQVKRRGTLYLLISQQFPGDSSIRIFYPRYYCYRGMLRSHREHLLIARFMSPMWATLTLLSGTSLYF